MIRVVRAALDELLRQARAAYPRECCGALLGRENGGERLVLRVAGVANADAEPRRGYLIEAEEVRRLEAAADAEGLVVLGFYHSHPDHPAVPSARDRESAWPWYSYVIVPAAAGAVGPPRAWRLAEGADGVREEEMPVEGE
ncbi:MAG TPA: M67 family metallopeptidase [Longimicrobiales bacterium]|nr:M67 family metallopeptidase [Longimicrobiales bacterium]